MEKEHLSLIGYALVLAILVIAGSLFLGITRDPDIRFARRVFTGLVNGNQVTQSAIDWPRFSAVGSDVGADYAKFITESQRAYFRQAFIINFSLSFKNAGGDLKLFTNWRIYAKDNTKAIVAVSTVGNKTLLFTIAKKYDKRKLVSIQWKE
ncbi:MAG: hypothetical protein NT066_05915 [Candidatus Omnitrophica bacterium]|nr:hypothetical protein [Candidatus Omnitrophota bacterium]